MPAFYPRTMPRDLPLTPPEFVPTYNSSGGVNMQYQQGPYSAHPGMGVHDEAGYRFAERYDQAPPTAPSSMIYQQPAIYSNPSTTIPPTNAYYDAALPILPPLRVSERDNDFQYQRCQEPARVEPPKEEKPATGGVSAKLDYDMEVMTDFVTEMAQGMYDLFDSPAICIADIDLLRSVVPGRLQTPSFRKWVSQVLQATRLPSATILLSLQYLAIRMTMIVDHKDNGEKIYRLLTIALVLGSKFLDDNTFINRSWSEVSGIPVKDLNKLEAEWLNAIDFKLHLTPSEETGFNEWLNHWKDYEAHAVERVSRRAKLSPINTNIQRQPSVHKSYTPLSFQSLSKPAQTPQEFSQPPQSAYTPAYTPFDPWLVPRPTAASSPASAPHTGPTTPEYYGGPGTWAPLEGHRRSLYGGFHTLPQPQCQPQLTPQSAFPSANYPSHYGSNYWNGHGMGCNCFHCSRQHAPFFMNNGYGATAVAA